MKYMKIYEIYENMKYMEIDILENIEHFVGEDNSKTNSMECPWHAIFLKQGGPVHRNASWGRLLLHNKTFR